MGIRVSISGRRVKCVLTFLPKGQESSTSWKSAIDMKCSFFGTALCQNVTPDHCFAILDSVRIHLLVIASSSHIFLHGHVPPCVSVSPRQLGGGYDLFYLIYLCLLTVIEDRTLLEDIHVRRAIILI